MKKLVGVIGLLLLLPLAGLQSQDWGSVYTPGDLTLSAGVGGLAFGHSFSLAVYPGAELILHEFVVKKTVPLEVGVAARGLFNLFHDEDSWGDYGWMAFGGGAFGTVHFSFRGSDLNIPAFLEKVDFHTALGLAYTYIKATGDWGSLSKYADTGLGFAAYGGVSYFFKPGLAVYLEGNYWDFGAGGAIGALLKL